MRRRRVLHLIDTPGPGGAETAFLELVSRLPRYGWDSVPVAPAGDWLAGSLRALDLDAFELDARGSFNIGYVRALRHLVRDEAIDLVQTHFLGTSVYATVACVGTRVPVVSTFHGQPDIPSAERFRRIKVALLRRGPNRVVCVSQSLREHFVANGSLSTSAEVIPNGIDLQSFTPGRRGELRSELGLTSDVPLVGAVGNVRPSKAYDVLLAAFARVKATVPQAQLVIAGEMGGGLGERLRSLQVEFGTEGSVHFLGFRQNVPEVMGAFDVFALSSSDEGFSLATVQAMAMGLPVVATRSGGPEDIVGDSEAALLVPTNDPVALASEIVRVLEDRTLASSLGAAARRHVASRFPVERMVESYARLYDRVLGTR